MDPLSLNNVQEYQRDTDSDDTFDEWMVVVRPGTELELLYTMDDDNHDESPDSLTVGIMQDKTLYGLRRYPDYAHPDHQVFSLSDLRGQPREDAPKYKYFDINLDGRLDVYEVINDSRREFVLLENAWVEVSAEPSGNWVDGYVAQSDELGEIRVVFDWQYGNWRIKDGSG